MIEDIQHLIGMPKINKKSRLKMSLVNLIIQAHRNLLKKKRAALKFKCHPPL